MLPHARDNYTKRRLAPRLITVCGGSSEGAVSYSYVPLSPPSLEQTGCYTKNFTWSLTWPPGVEGAASYHVVPVKLFPQKRMVLELALPSALHGQNAWRPRRSLTWPPGVEGAANYPVVPASYLVAPVQLCSVPCLVTMHGGCSELLLYFNDLPFPEGLIKLSLEPHLVTMRGGCRKHGQQPTYQAALARE
eukprot:1157376-Pelagomonas_calceolata.AAC.9